MPHPHSPSKRAKCKKRRTLRHRVEELEEQLRRMQGETRVLAVTQEQMDELMKGQP